MSNSVDALTNATRASTIAIGVNVDKIDHISNNLLVNSTVAVSTILNSTFDRIDDLVSHLSDVLLTSILLPILLTAVTVVSILVGACVFVYYTKHKTRRQMAAQSIVAQMQPPITPFYFWDSKGKLP
jgi:hypothetical protein